MKNVKVNFDKTSALSTSLREKFSSSASVGFGPFTLRGNYATDDAEQTLDFQETDGGFVIPDVQVIGISWGSLTSFT